MALSIDAATVEQLRTDLALAETEAERLTAENMRLRGMLKAARNYIGDAAGNAGRHPQAREAARDLMRQIYELEKS